MARLSLAAYTPAKEAFRRARVLGFEPVGLIDCDGTQALLSFKVDEVRLEAVIAFRGTQLGELEDWLADVQFCKERGPFDHKVHEGFVEAFDKAWPAIDAVLEGLRLRALREGLVFGLAFTGHSLGGALANLGAATALERRDPKRDAISGLWTFGAPRVGGRGFARKLEELLGPQRIHRWRHHNDVVTRIPPALLNFRHAGDALYLDRRGRLRRGLGFWASSWDRLIGRLAARAWRPWRWKTDGLQDHAMTEYLRLLEALSQEAAP